MGFANKRNVITMDKAMHYPTALIKVEEFLKLARQEGATDLTTVTIDSNDRLSVLLEEKVWEDG